MNYYTSTISVPLAEKLKEKGMPYIEIDCETYDSGTEYQRDEVWCNNTYAEVFDWLMSEKSHMIIVLRGENKWVWWIGLTTDNDTCNDTVEIEGEPYDTWHEAAEAAIEKALTLI